MSKEIIENHGIAISITHSAFHDYKIELPKGIDSFFKKDSKVFEYSNSFLKYLQTEDGEIITIQLSRDLKFITWNQPLTQNASTYTKGHAPFDDFLRKEIPNWKNIKLDDKSNNIKLILIRKRFNSNRIIPQNLKKFQYKFYYEASILIRGLKETYPKDVKPEVPIKKISKEVTSEMTFGHIDGTQEGQVFASREELGLSGIHTPPMHGIWGRESEGSASIVISGGYEDDIDDGDYILYTGQGGQDAPGGKQIKDQEFTRGNKGLQLNKEYNLPVRVTRGYQVEKGPDKGYRYDGLYYVTEYERVKGKEGFQVCRFHLQREKKGSPIEDTEHSTSPTDRVEYTGNRLKRNVNFAEQIKELYNNTCQVCNVFLKTPIEGLGISEAAHIKAIGSPHDGPDTKANMFCLCPNHHAQFDRYTFYIDSKTLEIIGLDEYKGESITINKKHKVNVEYFEYQKQQYLQNNKII
jgi:putative restriction endonuclease